MFRVLIKYPEYLLNIQSVKAISRVFNKYSEYLLNIQSISMRMTDFSSVIFLTAKSPQLKVQWNKYVKDLKSETI